MHSVSRNHTVFNIPQRLRTNQQRGVFILVGDMRRHTLRCKINAGAFTMQTLTCYSISRNKHAQEHCDVQILETRQISVIMTVKPSIC